MGTSSGCSTIGLLPAGQLDLVNQPMARDSKIRGLGWSFMDVLDGQGVRVWNAGANTCSKPAAARTVPMKTRLQLRAHRSVTSNPQTPIKFQQLSFFLRLRAHRVFSSPSFLRKLCFFYLFCKCTHPGVSRDRA